MNFTVRAMSSFCIFAGVGLLITLSGCSGNPSTAKVTGKVTYDGGPVTSGSVTFAPVSGTEGKPATGVVQSDGSYALSTYAEGDGAVVGSHRVTYVAGGGDSVEEEPAPEGDDAGEHDEDEPATAVPFSGLVPKQTQVTVEAGGSEINIELVAGGGSTESQEDESSSGSGEHAE